MSNTEKIIAEIQRLKKDLDGYSAKEALDYIESYINLNSREPSLPADLDEAAAKYAIRKKRAEEMEIGEEIPMGAFFLAEEAFKAGAEWMAGQGVKATASVGYYNQCGLSILTEPSIKKLGFKEGDEVEIIIRKKQ